MSNQWINFNDRAINANSQISEDVGGGAFTRLMFDIQAAITNGAAPTMATAGPANLIRDLRILSNSSVIATATGQDWFYISELFNGGVSDYAAPSTASTAVDTHATIDVDFDNMMPGAALDGTGTNQIGYRADFGNGGDLSGSGSSALSGTVRAKGEHPGGVNTARVYVPRIQYQVLDGSTASTNIVYDKRFETPGQLLGFFIRTTDNGTNANGLVKRMTVKRTPHMGSSTEVFDGTWSEARTVSQRYFGSPAFIPDGDGDPIAFQREGMLFMPARTKNNIRAKRATRINPGDRYQIRFDNTGTAEGHYTSVTPGSGDQIFVVALFFEGSEPGPVDRSQRGVAAVGNNSGRTRAARGR